MHLSPDVILNARVYDISSHSGWRVSRFFADNFPTLISHIRKVALPLQDESDSLVWQSSDTGDLVLKDTYSLFTQQAP